MMTISRRFSATPLWIAPYQMNVSLKSLTLLANGTLTLNNPMMVPSCMRPLLSMIFGLMRENDIMSLILLRNVCRSMIAENLKLAPISFTAPTPVPSECPNYPNGSIVPDDDSSDSSNSSDNGSIVSAAANDPFIAEVQHCHQRPMQNEGATLVGQRHSKRLGRCRNPRPLYSLTELALNLLFFQRNPAPKPLQLSISALLGLCNLLLWPYLIPSKQPGAHESLYLAKVTLQDQLLLANLD